MSYAALIAATGGVLMVVVFVFLLRYIPRTGAFVNRSGDWAPSRHDLLDAFLPRALGTLGVLIALGLVIGWLLAGRMLLPLRKIESAARLAAGGSLRHRVSLNGPHNEFRRVADTFDMMLARIERNVGEHQRFAANASHELRTPLAITHNVIELARADPDRDIEVVLAELASMNSRAISLTEGLLLLTKIERQPIVPEQIDLALVVEDVVETPTLVDASGDVSIQIVTEPVWVSGAPVLLRQLVANLLRNAVVHNVAADPIVYVRADRTADGRARIMVENTGVPLTDEQVVAFIEPFQRGANRTRMAGPHQVGAGLGLAIVDSIARAHDADLRLRARPGGGLIVAVLFPAARSGSDHRPDPPPHAGVPGSSSLELRHGNHGESTLFELLNQLGYGVGR
ncbi:sensor histidine kinase [Microlunatus sp. GCM10028923]|uniref:sensor histidine kinase n=1 Tax=Microlunatus sp. GCM10028923 TaxID=3273400 RepID=UPI0036146C49